LDEIVPPDGAPTDETLPLESTFTYLVIAEISSIRKCGRNPSEGSPAINWFHPHGVRRHLKIAASLWASDPHVLTFLLVIW
jgi:hypothetical protein